jgi:opacity protein-like surface antigen
MRKVATICIVLLSAATAEAQSPEPPKWDVNLSVGVFESRPFEQSHSSGDEWYGEARYAASIGYYWSKHFKTEFEFVHTGEGRRWTRDIVRVPGTAITHPISTEVLHRLQQGSARVVWQFNDNAWVHPYLNAGFVFDADRRTRHSPAQFYYPPYNPGDPRAQPALLLRPEIARGNEEMEYRSGLTGGGGAKFYMTPNSYLNTGLQVTYAKPATTAAVVVGFGIDF